MGKTTDEEGESSTQTCDADESDERPLKKARYIWQIKGKYHLKKPGDEDKDKMKQPLPEHASPISDTESLGTMSDTTESNTVHMEDEKETLGPTDRPTVESNAVEQVIEEYHEGTPHAVQQLANAFSSWELRKWQDRQIARSFVDNTINRVIEVMGLGSIPFDASEITDEEFPALDNGNDDDVEDEAVLMAIHSHGLQRSEQEDQDPRVHHNCEEKFSIVPCICNQHAPVAVEAEPYPFHQRPVFTNINPDMPSAADLHVEHKETVLPDSAINSFLNVYPSSAIICNNFQNSSEESPIKVHVKNPLEGSVVRKEQAKSVELSSDMGTQSTPKDDKNTYFEHNDFLDQAVGVAIQKKGLSTLSCSEFG